MHIDPQGYNRRDFFRQLLLGGSVLLAGSQGSCKENDPLSHIKGSLLGANSATGHLLRNTSSLPAPVTTIHTDVLIVGGGISALSAKRWLLLHGHADVMLLELDNHFGGNAHHGKNDVSAYPWGAHYLPVPDLRNKELLDFLQTTNTITGYDATGLPVYNDYHLCHDPEERLYINGFWQEGMVPDMGVPPGDKAQIKRFAKVVNDFKTAVGSDGKDAFTIPLHNSSADEQFRSLDKISFRKYLDDEAYTSRYLRWYLEYGCKDDYGCNLDTTSAWAGMHYFASRKGKGANASSSAVLTWPEGNGFLMEHLRRQAGDNLLTNRLVYNIAEGENGITVSVYDVTKKESYTVVAKKVIISAPQYVNKHFLSGLASRERLDALNAFHYAPWVIANITINGMPQGKGLPLCWDNVIYGTNSVGYVNANNQNLNNSHKKVITFYLPLAFDTPEKARQNAFKTSYKEWLGIIVKELEYAHDGIAAYIESADLWIWGHGMIAPQPGFIWGEARKAAAAPINNKIFFAHTDLSGISIFEEAFYQGIKAANQLMATI